MLYDLLNLLEQYLNLFIASPYIMDGLQYLKNI